MHILSSPWERIMDPRGYPTFSPPFISPLGALYIRPVFSSFSTAQG
jgi:hypothetical protein